LPGRLIELPVTLKVETMKMHVMTAASQRRAGEMIGGVTLAITNNLLVKKLAETVDCYPTQAGAVQRIALEYARTPTTVVTTIT
jgi:hypothetical protein